MRASDFGLDPPGRQAVALMMTRRCNMSCGHCSVASGPRVGGEPDEAALFDWLRQAATAGVRSIRITGGEPMLRASLAIRLIAECRQLGMGSALTTNGFWATSDARARRQLRALRRAGLGSLTVSYDRYHADFQGPEPILRLARLANDLALPLNVSVVRARGDEEFADLAKRLTPAPHVRLRLYDLQLVGRARDLAAPAVRHDAEGFCSGCSFPAIGEDGRLMACNGPAYFEPADSPLVIGSLASAPLAVLLERYRADPILNVIRTRGPAGLRDELRRTPGFETFPFRPRYFGICDLCHHITRDAAAVAALRRRLSQPDAIAVQTAAWQVIAGSQRHGPLSLDYVNGPAACRLFLRAALRPDRPFGPDAARVFGHAHLDWRSLTRYLAGSGLARPLQPALSDPELRRWAPAFVADELGRRALRDGLRELVQREIVEQLAAALRAIGGRGILLKGMALLMRAPAGTVSRATSDVDILVDARIAPRLRAHLLANGFRGAPAGAHAAVHHLEPVSRQGVPVEIHTRIMPSYWGLPERELIDGARDLPGLAGVATLGPEAIVLHSAVHLTASFFSFGLKTAWDIHAVLRQAPAFDWDRLAAWGNRLGAPRAFWTPVRALADGLDLPLPSSFLATMPIDRDARRLDLVARRRIFRGTEGLFDLDAFTKAGLTLMAQDSLAGRLQYLAEKVRWRGSRPASWGEATARARRADAFRQAWRHYRRYRRALATAPVSDDAG